MADNDDDLDYSNVPNDSGPLPLPAWAMVTADQKQSVSLLQPMPVALPSKQDIIAQTWLFALDKKNKNEMAKVKAMEITAKLSGYLGDELPKNPGDEEDDSNITADEVKAVREEWDKTY